MALGKLHVESWDGFRDDWKILPIERGQALTFLAGRKFTPLFEAACGHLTFAELPTLHLFANRRLRLARSFYLTWEPSLDLVRPNDDDALGPFSVCRRSNLEMMCETPEEQGFIAKFFLLAENKDRESFEARQTRLETQPLQAFKGFQGDLTCLGFQYCTDKTFYFKDIELCKQGAHVGLYPTDVFAFYPRRQNNRYFRVLIEGAKHGPCASVTGKLQLLEELSEEALDNLSGVFETPRRTFLRISGLTVGEFDHFTNKVVWHLC